MKYRNAAEVLPERLLKEIQAYMEGEVLYIPKLLPGAQQGDQGTGEGRLFPGNPVRSVRPGTEHYQKNCIPIDGYLLFSTVGIFFYNHSHPLPPRFRYEKIKTA